MDSGPEHKPEVTGPIVVPRTSMAWVGTGVATIAAAIAVLILILERNEYTEAARGSEVKIAELEANVKDQADKLALLDREKLNAVAIAKQREDDEKAAAKALVDKISGAVPNEVAKGDVKITADGSRVKIELADGFLFGNETIELTDEGKEMLARLGAVLANVEQRRIDVVGHTDNRRMKKSDSDPASSPEVSLWGLSVARATVVGRILEEEGKVAPAKLTISGRAAAQPLVANNNNKNRQRNRRVEILLTPFPAAPTEAPK